MTCIYLAWAHMILFLWGVFETITTSKGCSAGLHTCLLHMKSNTSAGIMELWIDGELIGTYSGNCCDGNNFTRIGVTNDYAASSSKAALVSCVVISNEKITFDYPKAIWSFDPENEISFDVIRNTTLGPEKNFDVVREIVKRIDVDISADVIRRIVNCHFTVDLERNLLHEVNLFKTNSEDIIQGGGTVSAVSVEKTKTDIENPFGLQSFEINLAEQQLTDQITFTAAQKFEIMQYIGGQFFDYYYELRIESLTQQGALSTYHCCYNRDSMLYELNEYPRKITKTIQDDTNPQGDTTEEDDDTTSDYIDEGTELTEQTLEKLAIRAIKKEEDKLKSTKKYLRLSQWAELLFAPFLSEVVVRIDEYGELYSSISIDDIGGRNMMDSCREIFGWTARLPHKMINAYIRADKIFFVQRGSEEHVIDITNTKHTQPTITHELVRTVWGATPINYTAVVEKILGTRGSGNSDDDNPDSGTDPSSDDDDDKENPWSAIGSVTSSNSAGTTVTTYSYTSDGVLTGTTTVFTSNVDPAQSSTTTVKNSYGAGGLLQSVTTEVIHPSAPEEDKKTVTTYGYLTLADGRTFLANETTAEYEKNSDGNFELVDTNVITKSPTGRGQGTSYSSQGKGSASGNIGDDRVTPYQIRSAFKTKEALKKQTLKRLTSTTLNGFTDVDPSFPLLEYDFRAKVTEEIKNLNRKTKETVNLNIYNFEHIIDFNDRIILDDKEYFLASNTVRTTSRIYNEQSLTLVRWIDSG